MLEVDPDLCTVICVQRAEICVCQNMLSSVDTDYVPLAVDAPEGISGMCP